MCSQRALPMCRAIPSSLDTIEPGIKLLGEQIQRYFDGEKVETVIQM